MRIAVLSMRYLGDCVLSAALCKAIKTHNPQDEVWMLTFRDNLSILSGMDFIDGTIGFERRPSYLQELRDFVGIWKSFDWAIVTQKSTRSLLYGYAAGKKVVMRAFTGQPKNAWMHALVSQEVTAESNPQQLDVLATLLEPICGSVPDVLPVAPSAPLESQTEEALHAGPYVVFQASSRFADKNLSFDFWTELGSRCIAAGYRVAFTGGGSQDERRTVEAIARHWAPKSWLDFLGKLSFGQSAEVIRRAAAYVGVDTATSHVAGAVGTPAIVLFGMTSVSAWGPAPQSGARRYKADQALQRAGNVTIIQHPKYLHCQACRPRKEGTCPLWPDHAYAACLQSMPVDLVWEELKYRLGL